MSGERPDDFEGIARWLRSERPPFDESDLAAIRRGVWRDIEARRARRPSWVRLCLAGGAAAAVAFLIAVVLAPWTSRPGEAGRPVPSPAPEEVASIATRPAEAPLATLPPARPRPSAARPRPPARPEPAPVTIEFQTVNPNVRIIWLVRRGEAPPRPLLPSSIEEVS